LSIFAIFVVIYEDSGAGLRNQINRNIASDTGQLSHLLGSLDRKTPGQVVAVAQRYVRAQPYTASSTLLFVLVPGEATVSNHPEVFVATGPEEGETLEEQERENQAGRELLVPRIGYSTHPVPDVGAMRISERAVRAGHLTVVAGAGEPLDVVEQAQHGIARAFALAGAVTLAIALLASYLAGARVSAPLRRHELRTPLTVMRGQLDVLVSEETLTDGEVRRVERLVQAEISRISRLVDDLLVLAAAEQTNFLRPARIELHRFIAELWDGISLTAERHFELGSVPGGTLRADPDRLAQACAISLATRSSTPSPNTGSFAWRSRASAPIRSGSR
jgi:signal transduction histidine kinase